MITFLIGFLIGIFSGIFYVVYRIVLINVKDPARFDQIIGDLREKIQHRFD